MFKAKVSWRYIIAGAVAAVAVSIIMALLGMALGFAVVDPMSSTPFAGVGTAVIVWSVVSVLVSLAVGGYVAGYFAGTRGGEHGFMVWAVVLLTASVFGTAAIGSAVKTVTSAAYEVGSGAASAVSAVGGGVANFAVGATERIYDRVNLGDQAGELRSDVAAVLRDTGEERLQPEYLERQMRDARSDLRYAMNQLALDTENYDEIFDSFLDKQKARVADITADVDRETVVAALMNNRDMSREEANQAVDNALAVYARGVERAKGVLDEADRQVEESRAYLAQVIERARIRADEASRTAAKSALAAAAALVLGAVASWLAGMCGARRSARYYPRGQAAIYQETILREPALMDS